MEPPRRPQVSVESFAAQLTITDGGLKIADIIPEEIKLEGIKLQRIVIQSGPKEEQTVFLAKFSAKYLPRLMTAWINNEGALNSHACMLNLIASNAVLNFGRFMELPEARGMVALQVKRMATENDYLRRNDDPRRYDADDLGEIGQFLSSLLMYQGDSDVDPRHRAVVINKLTAVWSRYGNGFAGVTSERCLEYLEGDPLSIMA